MHFSIEPGLFGLFPSLRIGVVVCRIDNTRYGDDGLEAVLEELRQGFGYEKPQDHPNIRVWREAFRALNISPAKYYSSIESLVRRVLKGGPFPRVNPIVDLYNAFSLKYLVPMGGHDLMTIEGDILLGYAKGGERFTPMDGGEAEAADAGEVVYRDKAEILTRRWVWRQSNKDKVTAHTGYIFIPVDVMAGLPDSLCNELITDFELTLVKNRYGKVVHKDILTKENPVTEF